MSKIMFVGDIHLTNGTPISRKDQYSQTVLEKIESLAGIVESNEVDVVIYEGDIFNSTDIPLSYLIKCLSAFRKIKVPQYFIIGNHDITYERLENYYKAPLNLLEMTGTLKHLTFENPLTFEDDNVYVFGYDYGVPIQPVQRFENATTICVAHTYYDNELYGKTSTMITPQDALDLGYNIYVLGHDHSIYDPVINGAFKIYRHGSLTRGTSSSSNLERDIYVGLFDTSTKEWSLISVPHLPSKDVFREKVILEKDKPIEYSLDNIIDNLDSLVNTSNAYTVMDEMNLDPDVVKLITYYLESHNLYRKESV